MKPGSESHSPTRAVVRALFAVVVCVVGISLAWAAPSGAQTDAADAPAASGCGFTKPDAIAANGGPLGEAIWGQLCQRIDGKPTYPSGVTITVKQDGKVVGSETTGANGVFVVQIPGNGTYQVSLDKASLPKEMTLTDSGRTSLDKVAVQFGDQQVIFPLGVASSGGRPFSDYATTFAKGLRFGLILAVASVGLSLVYGVTGLVNFAHAELVTFGAIVAYTVSEAGVPFWLALPVAVGFGAVLGLGNERLLWRPLRRRRMSLLSMMVVSIGLSIALRNIFQIQFGPDGRRYEAAAGQRERAYGPFRLTDNDLLIMVVCVVVLFGMTWLLRRTRTGTAIRAVADNHDLAESSGIAVDRIVSLVWMLCGGLAALGGILYGLSTNITFDMGLLLLLSMFAAIVLGGLGNAYGAVLGAVLIGVVQEMSGLLIDTAYKFVVAMLVLIVVLLIRPQGILGTRERFG